MSRQYKYPSAGFEFDQIEPKPTRSKPKGPTPKRVGGPYKESTEVKLEHTFQQLMNELYDDVDKGEAFNLRHIERTLVKLLLAKFNRTQTAKMLGFSVRTLRNKINENGYQNIREN